MEVHPIADIWPLMSEVELVRLAEDIAEHGQVMPIILVEGLILDGRNRWLACERLGVEPWTETVETDDPDALAWSLNEHRRHANEGMRAMAAAKRANMKVGRPSIVATGTISQADAARQFNVSRESVNRAGIILEHGSPQAIAAVESGDIAVSLAAKTVRRLQETGESFTSIADLKKTMRQIFREENPLPERPAKGPREPPQSHVSIDTFGVVRAVVRHATDNPAPIAAAQIDKWTRLNILDDLPPAIAYLTELKTALTGEGNK